MSVIIQTLPTQQFPTRTKGTSLWPPLEKLPRRHKGIRASKPKTKTGCWTCKNRRVKCDEGRPSCQKCQRYGTECGGYLPRGKKSESERVFITAKILPKDQCQISRLSDIPLIYSIQSGRRFRNEQESRYFRIYCDETSLCITGAFQSALWKRLIPQASEVEPFIRHAMIAVGALTKLAKDKKKNLAPDAAGPTYALKKYDESLQGMRKAIARGDCDVRKVLIACLLIFCFETLQGNFSAAISHAERGLMLFYQSVSTIELGGPSPAQMLEGDLMHAYAGLDLYIVFFRDTRSEEIHRALISHQNLLISQMPTVFSDLEEARKFWFMIMRRNYHFSKLASINAAMNAPKTLLENDENLLENFYPAMQCMVVSPGKPSSSLRAEYEQYSDELRQCVRACSALFEKIRREGTVFQRLLVDILSMHAKVTDILLTGIFMSSEMDYDALLPDFREILAAAQAIHPQILELAEGSAGFHYGYGVNYPLFLIGLRCREQSVRDAAIQLLGSREHREGIWDAMALATIARWVRNFEQNEMNGDDFVIESQRVFLTGCYLNMQRRKAFIRVARRINSGLALTKVLVNW
ncbi:hypothetical protein N431DRAFT_357255 [Stipitochalara longipes BDJ]|nr:hypothetical protein N431DRAFT_357255 [Stipitochalara longipes BDJ]